MNKSTIITILVVIIIGAGAFFAGMKYQQTKEPAFNRQFSGGQGARMGAGNQSNRLGFRPVAGEIISTDDKSITVKLQDGSTKIVMVSDKTDINKAAQVNRDELKVGEKVSVFGQENSDGSVTAQSIQLNPIIRGQPTIQQ